MVMKKDGRKRDIKSKLVAAVCMLLVSCIMMVSSTYAWFTLSTAPEVKGITTAIGANGNLEMALLPESGKLEDITTSTSQGESQQLINVTWGNLVDVSEGYGMDKITLYPAQLNATGNMLTDGSYLKTPTYGADGRINGFNTSVLSAIYKDSTFGTGGKYGIRALGTSSGMSAREQAYRDAISAANAAANKAGIAASTALSAGGSSLASIAMKKAMDSNATFTQAEVQALQNAFTALTNETGALTYAEEALRQYILANAILGFADDNYAANLGTIQNADLAALTTYASTNMQAAITALNGTKGTVTTAASSIATLLEGSNADTTYTWDQIDDYVSYLADIDGMKLNNQELSYWLTKTDGTNYDHMQELMGQVSNLVLTISKSGIYVEVANLVGGYNASVTMNNLTFGGWNLSGIKANMKVVPETDPSHLANAKKDAGTFGSDEFSAGGGNNISDFYGYIIDLAFRTNAAGSNLLLQTSAIDRIYSDNESNAATMGGGSTMTFSYSDAAGYPAATLIKLMSNIRVVFFDPANHEIKGYARLDADNASTDTAKSTVTMELKMWDITANVQEGVAKGAWAESNAIMPLIQNQAAALSAMVYLDGENVTNAEVANFNIDGKMNLQFASSAELTPMEYGDLREGNDATTEYTVTVNGVTATEKVTAGEDYTMNVSSVTVPEGQAIDTITVKMGGQEVAGAYDATAGTVSVDDVNGNIEVTVTFKAAT